MIPDFLKEISASSSWISVQKVEKGWSREQKFCATDRNGKRFLIRLADALKHDAKRKEFEMMQRVVEMGISMSIPLDFGLCGNGQYVYSLFSWVEGTAFDDTICSFSQTEQYEFGKEAGLILKKMHSLSAPTNQEEWEQRLIHKISKHLKKYQTCGFKVKGDEKALKFITSNLHLLKNRPQVFQHGDFHIGNLILSPDRKLHVIDFNRWDYGDPWEEFYKMGMFSREKSIPFTVGQLHGYFNDKVPDQFFELLALYLADVILFSVVWAIPFGEKDVRGMLERADMIMADYNGFETTLPNWFSNWTSVPVSSSKL